MNYDETRDFLASALTFGIKLGLHRMYRLMELLQHPEKNLRCIHIAGTNGKGSVSSYCAAILAAAGLKTGVFTSPYLVRLTERIRIVDGRPGLDALAADETAGEISPAEFAAVMTTVREAVQVMLSEGGEHPTEFELLTAAGFLHFAACGCDVVVLETGLGGRLDSTNVIDRPLACLITALGFDHMDRLGSTMPEIAAEKAGIIKPGRPVYLYDPRDLQLSSQDAAAALETVSRRCAEQGAPLQLVSRQEIETLDYGWNGQTFTDRVRGLTFQTSLLGIFQPQNAALAARACLDLGLAASDAVREGIRLTRWPARLEVLRRQPPILLDGAHNPQGCEALSAALSRLLPGRPVVYLAGMLQDKDHDVMLRLILANPDCRPIAFICVRPDSPRALPAGQLAAEVGEIARQLHTAGYCGYNVLDNVHAIEDPAAGARLALRLAGEHAAALCAFGSLYMVGSIRSILSDQEEQLWTGKS